MSDDIRIRDLASPQDYADCVALQHETWGESFTESVPATMLRISQKLGGVAAGAFQDDVMLGFVFGLTGLQNGVVIHWSDMLAVKAGHRNHGIGEKLKRYQRDKLLALGVGRMLWTFDPLDAKNAHINFNRLGVFAREYVVDMYGQTSSPLHAFGTDRLIVTWELAAEQPRPHDHAHEHEIEIPADIHAINRADPALAQGWRERTREQFTRWLPRYVVCGFERRGESGFYALTPASNFAM